MALTAFNISLEDSSPLIHYDPVSAWTDSPQNASSYSGSSFHSTTAHGASLSFSFNGTGVWLYGAHQPNYGAYNVSVDGKVVAQHDASSSSAAFQQVLGAVSDLEMGSHTVTLTNAGPALDIDYVTFQTATSGSDQPSSKTLDDMDSSLSFGSQWEYGEHEGFWNNTIHYTEGSDAEVQFSFDGDAVAVYGTSAPSMGNYTVTLDGIDQQFNGGSDGSVELLHAQTLLYFATGLNAESHNMVITANPSKMGDPSWFELDAISILSSGNSNGSAQPDSQLNAVTASKSSTFLTNKGVLSAAIAAAIICLLGVIFLFVFCWKRHQADPPSCIEKNEKDEKQFSPASPQLPIQDAKDSAGFDRSDDPPAYREYSPYRSYHESVTERSTAYESQFSYGAVGNRPSVYSQSNRSSEYSNYSRNSAGSFDSMVSDDSRRILIDDRTMPPQFSRPMPPIPAVHPLRPNRKRETVQIPF